MAHRILHATLQLILDPPPVLYEHEELALAESLWQLLEQLGDAALALCDWSQSDEGAALRAARTRPVASIGGGGGDGGDGGFVLGLGSGDGAKADEALGARRLGISVTRNQAKQAADALLPLLGQLVEFCSGADEDTRTDVAAAETTETAFNVVEGLSQRDLERGATPPSGALRSQGAEMLSALAVGGGLRLGALLRGWALSVAARMLRLLGPTALSPCLAVYTARLLLLRADAAPEDDTHLSSGHVAAAAAAATRALPPAITTALQQHGLSLTSLVRQAMGTVQRGPSVEAALQTCLAAVVSSEDEWGRLTAAVSATLRPVAAASTSTAEEGSSEGAVGTLRSRALVARARRCASFVKRWCELCGPRPLFRQQCPRLLRALLPCATHASQQLVTSVAEAFGELLRCVPGETARELVIGPAIERFLTFEPEAMRSGCFSNEHVCHHPAHTRTSTTLLTTIARHSSALQNDDLPGLLLPFAFFASMGAPKPAKPLPGLSTRRIQPAKPQPDNEESATASSAADTTAARPGVGSGTQRADQETRSDSETIQAAWTEVWNAHVAGSTADALALHLPVLIESFVRRCLLSESRAAVCYAARCLHKITRIAAHSVEAATRPTTEAPSASQPTPTSAPSAASQPSSLVVAALGTLEREHSLFATLVRLIRTERPFAGKEVLLRALVSLALALGAPASASPEDGNTAQPTPLTADSLGALLAGEVRRGAVEYRLAALRETGRYAAAFKVDVLARMLPAVLPLLAVPETSLPPPPASDAAPATVWVPQPSISPRVLPAHVVAAVFSAISKAWPSRLQFAHSQRQWAGVVAGLCWVFLRELPVAERAPVLRAMDTILPSIEPSLRPLVSGVNSTATAASQPITLPTNIALLAETLDGPFDVLLPALHCLFHLSNFAQQSSWPFPHLVSLTAHVTALGQTKTVQDDPSLRVAAESLCIALKQLKP